MVGNLTFNDDRVIMRTADAAPVLLSDQDVWEGGACRRLLIIILVHLSKMALGAPDGRATTGEPACYCVDRLLVGIRATSRLGVVLDD